MKLCAIAKNEGPYIPDWIHHHLYYGFDAIEVWVNGSDDSSLKILRRIGKRHPNVSVRKVDRLLEVAHRRGKGFQELAYQQLQQKARRQGFTHAAFLDLDEYWMPRDSASTVQTFIPDRPEVKVVSFQWWTDVPDRSLKPFTPAVRRRMLLQADPHVKSVIRLDDALTQVRTHTARISAGTRLLVREPFPLFDELRQQWGSLVPAQVLENQPAELPEAFVLHAINRSESEYVARLAMGMRQVRYEATLKTNRKGYVASARPQVPFSPPRSAWRSYRRSLERFHKGLDLERLISKSRDATLARGAELRASLVKDSRRMAQLRIAMRGVNAPELDSEYPGWETASIRAHVDRVVLGDDSIRLHGWAYSVPSLPLEFALFQGDADSTMPLAVTSQERPDVRAAHPEAPLACGYTIEVTPYRPADWSTAALGVRPVGSRLWDRFTLPREALVRND